MLFSDMPFIDGLDEDSTNLLDSTITLVVVDDHPVVRFGIVNLLKAQPQMEVIGEASNCSDLSPQLGAKKPDVLILDLELGDACGPETLSRVRGKFPEQKIVIYTSSDSDACVSDTINIGVQGYVLKGSSIDRLHEAIKTVAKGGFYLDPALASKVMGHVRQGRESGAVNWSALTQREKSVMRLVAAGKRNKEIAGTLYISERTVKYHISSLFKKLKASNRTELVKVASSHGLVDN
jgi:DNA-binding NarL/FixJ family response regulator